MWSKTKDLNFVGEHLPVPWSRTGYAVNTEEDLALLIFSLGEFISYVHDTKEDRYSEI